MSQFQIMHLSVSTEGFIIRTIHYIILEIFVFNADPHQTTHAAKSDLNLQRLPRPLFMGPFRIELESQHEELLLMACLKLARTSVQYHQRLWALNYPIHNQEK